MKLWLCQWISPLIKLEPSWSSHFPKDPSADNQAFNTWVFRGYFKFKPKQSSSCTSFPVVSIVFKIVTILMDVKLHVNVVLISFFLMMSDIKHIFGCYWLFVHFLFEVSFKIFCPPPLFFGGTGVWTRASHLVGRCFYCLLHSASPCPHFCFE
jgi:hypothetical protein